MKLYIKEFYQKESIYIGVDYGNIVHIYKMKNKSKFYFHRVYQNVAFWTKNKKETAIYDYDSAKAVAKSLETHYTENKYET